MREKLFLFLFDVLYGIDFRGRLSPIDDFKLISLFTRHSEIAGVTEGLFHIYVILITNCKYILLDKLMEK